MTITEKALLVNLDISMWGAHKHDKTVSQKVEQDYKAHDAGRYNKALIKKESLHEVQNAASKARTFLYKRTLPWGDNGDRVLSSAVYFDFIREYKEFKDKFDVAVTEFIAQYPSLKDEAQQSLKDMYQETDYPSVNALWKKFGMDMKFMAIPNSDDFRIQLDKEEVDTLRSSIEQELNSRVVQATKYMYARIKDAVGHMVDRLSDKDALFRDTLITKIRELVEVLPRLNFTDDPGITDVVDSMKNLCEVKPDKLRHNTMLRAKKAEEAKAILDKVSGFLAS